MNRRMFFASAAGIPVAAKVKPIKGKPVAGYNGTTYLLFQSIEDRQRWADSQDVIYVEQHMAEFCNDKILGRVPTGEVFFMCRWPRPDKPYDRCQHYITHVEGAPITDHLRATAMKKFDWIAL